MNRSFIYVTKLCVAVALLMSNNTNVNGQSTNPQDSKGMNSILLKPWIGPYGGVPPWRQVNRDEFLGAFDAAIKISNQEIEAIANNPDPPTFENTFVALEKSGKTLNRLQTIFDVHTSNLATGPIPDIEKAVAPKMSKFGDSIIQNSKLFARIEAIYQGDEMNSLSVSQKRLVKDRYDSFVRQGAKLNDTDRAVLSQKNAALAGLFADFSQKVLSDEEGYITWISDADMLAGLPESTVAAMAGAASKRGVPITPRENGALPIRDRQWNRFLPTPTIADSVKPFGGITITEATTVVTMTPTQSFQQS